MVAKSIEKWSHLSWLTPPNRSLLKLKKINRIEKQLNVETFRLVLTKFNSIFFWFKPNQTRSFKPL